MTIAQPESGRRDYTTSDVRAAQQVLGELCELLAEFKDGIVLVGGWVPFFAIPDPLTPHEGTKDVDLALDTSLIDYEGDETIEEILTKALYQQDVEKSFRWYRKIEIDGKYIDVVVDFLTRERENYPNGRSQRIQDISASTMHGCDAAFSAPVEVPLITQIPSGEHVNTSFRMVSIQHFLIMKGIAFHNRDEMAQRDPRRHPDARKDASDIYFVVKNYKDGIDALADEFRPFMHEATVQESLGKIAAKWKSPKDRGPLLIAEREDDADERHRLQQDAFQQIHALLVCLGVKAPDS